MATKVASRKTKTSDIQSQISVDEARQRIQQAAYFKWLSRTDGTPVSDEDTVRYWCEAEQEFLQTQQEA